MSYLLRSNLLVQFILLVGILIFSNSITTAQSKESFDSNKLNLGDTIKINEALLLANKLVSKNTDSSIYYCNVALQTAEKLNWSLGEHRCYEILSKVYGIKGDSVQSMQLFERAVKVLDQMLKANPDKEIQKSQNTAKSNLNSQKFEKPITVLLNGIKSAEASGNNILLIYYLEKTGLHYQEEKNLPQSLHYYFRSLQKSYAVNKEDRVASLLNRIGGIYFLMNMPQEAIHYFQKALQQSAIHSNKIAMLENYSELASIYTELTESSSRENANYKQAFYYCTEALKLSKEIGNAELQLINLTKLGRLYTYSTNYSEAEKRLQEAMNISLQLNAPKLQKDIYRALSILYEKQGNTNMALANYKSAVKLRDSLFNEETENQLTRKEMNFEFERREAGIKLEQKKKDELLEQERKKQKIILWSVLIGLTLLIGFIIFITRSLHLTRKQKQVIESKKQEVENQKIEIEKKNKEINDSINYALRIQQAKLPRKSFIKENLQQSFVLYLPKDIVSGDFYFFFKTENGVYIAAVDCTGHGIPGAFMSMVGSEKLYESVTRMEEVSTILSHMNRGIKASLRQSDAGTSIRDGMDIALCRLFPVDKVVQGEACTLEFGGANRTLWICRKDASELEEYKPTKAALGGHTSDSQEFISYTISLNKGDTIYLFTDGYADTFGTINKKLTTKKFKQLLLEIQHLSMDKQEIFLSNFIAKWKGDTEQVDDILVIGVRI
ncbi:MAG TPA: SpoIIE family protein phosphatase [Bacteroidia bacterium]|nr:SpoIIE family protein phosphatase [Bacteroidia bacterium]